MFQSKWRLSMTNVMQIGSNVLKTWESYVLAQCFGSRDANYYLLFSY